MLNKQQERMSPQQVQSLPESIVAELFPEYRTRVCRYARWLTGHEYDAEEIVQDAFVRLAQREQKARLGEAKLIENESQFAGLLFTTVRNLSIDLLRKKGRRKSVPLSAANEPISVSNPDDASLHQLRDQIGELIEELPENWAEALKLKITGDLTYEQIAEVLNCTKPQVRTWIFRARRQLADEMAKRGLLGEEQ